MSARDRLLAQIHTHRLRRRAFLEGTAALGLAAGLAPGLLGRAAFAGEPKQGGTLRVGVTGGSATDSLDPTTYTASMHVNYGFAYGNALVEIDTNNQAIPELAESWEARAGATEWVINLRKGVTFHNGKEMDAEDVLFSLNLHRGEDTKSGAAGYMKTITDIKVLDKHQILITLESGNADLPYLLSDYHVLILPAGSEDLGAGIGTGPFIVESFEPGVRFLGRRNPDYWKEGRAHVDAVELLAINDSSARTAAVQSGEIDIMERVDPKTADLLKRVAGITIYQASGGGHYLSVMRTDTAPFDNNDVRLALKYAVDRQEILDKVLRGYGKLGNDHPIPESDPMWSPDIPQRPYDPEKATFHWKKADVSGPIQLSAAEAAFTGAVDTAVLMKEHAAKAGIEIEVIREPNDGYWSNVWMQKPYCMSYWGGRPTADLMLSVAYKSDAAWNDTFWRREDFDRLLVAARAELDTAKRRQMYHELQLMIHEDGGALIPMFNDFVDAARDNVKGFEPSPQFGLSGHRVAERCWLES